MYFRYTGAQYSFEDTFEVSESESDDDEFYLPSAARRRQLRWRHKPALAFESAQDADLEVASEAPSEAPSETPGERDAELGDDVAEAEEEARRRRERLHKIAQELMLTERKYVQELHLIDQVRLMAIYLNRLCRCNFAFCINSLAVCPYRYATACSS